MLSIGPSVISSQRRPGCEYERIVGIECRSPSAGGTTISSSSSPGPQINHVADILIASCDGSDTTIESQLCDFVGRAEPRLPILTINGRRDIVHASVSTVGPNGETIVSFTERLQLRGKPTTRPAPAAGAALGSPPTQQQQQSDLPPVVQYSYQLWLHVVNTDIFEDVTVNERPIGNHVNSVQSNQVCQMGYFIRSEQRSSLFWLRACDNAQSGLQIKELCYGKRKGTLEVRPAAEWNLAQNQLWHQWDPFTQRISFWAALPYYKFRVVRLCGHPDKRRCDFEQNIGGKVKHPLVYGRPQPQAWATANSTTCVNFHVVIVPVRYECDTEEYAMCRQLLPTAQVDVGRIVCSITMLRNYIDSIDVAFDLDEPIPPTENFRVAFVFVHGMIAIYLPGVFVHYVDVSHKERVPMYLFGVNLQQQQQQDQERHYNGEDITPSQVDEPPLPYYVTLPVPSGTWIFEPDTVRVMKVELDRQAVWKVIQSMLGDVENPHVAPADPRHIHNALHVVSCHVPMTTSAPLSGAARSVPSPISREGPLTNTSIALTASTDYFANQLGQLVQHHWRSIKPYFLAQLIVGEAYRATRDACKAEQNPYWLCIPMLDEKGIDMFIDETHHLGSVAYDICVDVEQKRDAKVKELCHNTDPEWWLVRGIKQHVSLFGKIKALGKSSFTPIHRINLSDNRTSRNWQLGQAVCNQLIGVGVPRDSAASVASHYCEQISKVSADILEIMTKPSESVGSHVQLHFLHNFAITLHLLKIPPTPQFVQRLAGLSAQQAPQQAFLNGVYSGLYSPNPATVEKYFRQVGQQANDNISSGVHFVSVGRGETPPPSTGSQSSAAAARAVPLSLMTATAADSASALYRPRMTPQIIDPSKLETLLVTSVVANATITEPPTTSSSGLSDTGADKLQQLVSLFEVGPLMQFHRAKFIPKDIEPTSFLPLKLWVNRIHKASSATTVKSNEQLRRQRAQEALTRALSPLVEHSVS